MRLLLVLAFLLGMGSKVNSAEPDLRVVSLFDQNSRIPNTLIPFQVEGALLAGGRLESVTVTPPANQDCRVMIDPYLKSTFLLKCLAPADVYMKVRVVSGLNAYDVNYGPVQVSVPFANVVVVPPGPGPGEDPDLLAGRQIYGAYCIRCHTPQSKAKRTAAAIRSALHAIPDMKSLNPILKDGDLAKIANYLGSL